MSLGERLISDVHGRPDHILACFLAYLLHSCPNALGNGQAVLGTPAPAAGDDHLFRFRFPAFEFINAAGQRENSVSQHEVLSFVVHTRVA